MRLRTPALAMLLALLLAAPAAAQQPGEVWRAPWRHAVVDSVTQSHVYFTVRLSELTESTVGRNYRVQRNNWAAQWVLLEPADTVVPAPPPDTVIPPPPDTIVPPPPAPRARFIAYASGALDGARVLADGDTVSGGLYIELDADYPVQSVDFYLAGEFVRNERAHPYTLGGDDSRGWDPHPTSSLPNGPTPLVAQVNAGADSETVSVVLVVHNLAEPPPPDTIQPPPPDTVIPPPPPPPPPSDTAAPPPSDGIAELPRLWVDTEWIEPTGQTIRVPAGGSIQAAIDAAQRGDVIELERGAVYSGNVVLRAKPGTGWITIRSAGELPEPGVRMHPRAPAAADRLAVIQSSRGDQRALLTESGASHYRIVGVELTYAPTVTQANSVVTIGNGSRHIILDRSYVHGHPGLNLQRCVTLHAEHGAVIDSWLSECHYKGADSQAIIVWNTNGPLKIVNNHLEGAGENVMIGGATPSENTLPADIEIRRNHFYKPAHWLEGDEPGITRWTIKNLFEVKFGVRMLLEGNVFDGNWKDGQDGHAFNIKLSSRGSGDRVSDFTLRYNVLRNMDHGIKIGSSYNRVLIEQNLMYNNRGRAFTILSSRDLHILDNTFLHESSIIISNSSNNDGFLAQRTIWGSRGGYGVKGSSVAEGSSTLNIHFPGRVGFNSLCIIGRRADRYPDDSGVFVADVPDVRFDSQFRLLPGSPCADMGADIDAVLAATAGVVQ